ncbi:MAG: hypothetical protein CMF96_09290 [Candidatus Marinimicrobia bacterium]|nr:hypothetical protein [Candidatus Neomarinimicrobiota bacterium]
MGGHNLNHSNAVYFKILIALFVLTIVTVGVTYIEFSSFALAIFVGLLIACFKGFLVAGNFMHLFDEVKSIYGLLILCIIFSIPLFFIPLLWDSNLVKEKEFGPWIGQKEEIKKVEKYDIKGRTN